MGRYYASANLETVSYVTLVATTHKSLANQSGPSQIPLAEYPPQNQQKSSSLSTVVGRIFPPANAQFRDQQSSELQENHEDRDTGILRPCGTERVVCDTPVSGGQRTRQDARTILSVVLNLSSSFLVQEGTKPFTTTHRHQ